MSVTFQLANNVRYTISFNVNFQESDMKIARFEFVIDNDFFQIESNSRVRYNNNRAPNYVQTLEDCCHISGMSCTPTSSQNKVGPRHVKSMMSVKMCISGNVIFTSAKPLCLLVVILFISYPTYTSSSCSSAYGATPCTFVPAPPGHTPPCAKPGLTYCEYPEHYPGERIKHLIQKWRYDHTTLLIDESQDEFSAYFYPLPDYNYNNLKGNFGSYGPPLPNHNGYYPEPIYIPKPQFPIDVNFYNQRNLYSLPNSNNYTGGFTGYPDARTHFKYTNDIPPVQLPSYQAARLQSGRFSPYSNNFSPLEAWNREDNFIGYNTRLRRATLVKSKIKTYNHKPKNSTTTPPTLRKKRQAALAGEPLCQARTQYIMPRAALNNKGNWMYVVNMPELDNRYTQLVKSETCRSQVCNGVCQLPVGYTSRCEQKYVQKRLVALEGGGGDLYTDVFWFPSCCVCTISNQ